MTDWQTEIRTWLKGLNLPPAREAEIVEELAQHVEDRYQDLLADGVAEDEAARAALAEMRHDGLLLDGLRRFARPPRAEAPPLGDGRGRSITAGILHDLRYGLRMLLKERGVTTVAVVTMALGIGVNTTVFSTLALLAFRPFAFANQQRLLTLWEQQPEAGVWRGAAAPGNFQDWREQSHSFEHLVALRSAAFDFSDGSRPERISGGMVSTDFFDALGAKAALGRTFAGEEGQAGSDGVVVLKHSVWRERFGGDPLILGRPVKLNGRPFIVIGVMPEDFNFLAGSGELWVPLVFGPQERAVRDDHYLQVFGLPRAGVTAEQVREDLNAIAARARQAHPETNSGRGVRVVPLVQDATRGVRVGAPFMFLSVLFVLLVACANVANLLLVRASSRRREIAVRLAVGASRYRVVRQLCAESVLLSILGGGLGLLLAVWGIEAVRGIPQDFSRFIPGWERMGIDRAALIFTVVLSVLSGVLSGLLPALVGTRVNFSESLKEGGRVVFYKGTNRVRGLLVISEVALSVVLLAGAGVMLRSFAELTRADLGINPANLLTMQISLDADRYASDQSRVNFYQNLLSRLAAAPGVSGVAAAGTLPLGYTYSSRRCASVGETIFPRNGRPSVRWRVATPGYFEVVGTRLLQGRDFTEQDRAGDPRVALVNEAFAKKFLPGRRVLGDRLTCGDAGPYEIIGVVANVINDDLEERAEPEVYAPYAQEAARTVYIVIRADSDPAGMAARVRNEVSALDGQAPVFNVKLMERIVDERLSPKRMAVYGLGAGALIALLLAAAGIYSLMSYSVKQRAHEIGLRLALGARPWHVVKLIVGGGMRLVLVGNAIGLVAAWALTRLLARLLFGVSAHDPATLVTIVFLLNGAALLACYAPARQAAKVDPMTVLRSG